MKTYTNLEAAVLAASLRHARRAHLLSAVAGFAWGALAALALLLLTGCMEIIETPTADYWLDRQGQVVDSESSDRVVGIRVESGAADWVGTPGFDADVSLAVHAVEAVCGDLPSPIVTVWMPGYVGCGIDNAAGCYLRDSDVRDHAYIQVSTSWAGHTAESVGDTALMHELCHHASGLSDTPEFAELVVTARILYDSFLGP